MSMRMRRNKQNVNIRIQIVVFIFVFLFVDVASGNTQQYVPITKENLIAALTDCKSRRHCTRCRRCKLKASDFIHQIKQFKVWFVLSDCDEREIRKAGDFLRETELNELIVTVRGEYFDDGIGPNGSRSNNFLDTLAKTQFPLLDSYDDHIVEGKVRLIHASINSTFRLDTNYRFYGGDSSLNIFAVSRADKNYPDGTLFIGTDLIKQRLTADPKKSQLANDSILYLLIGHEMSHLKQDFLSNVGYGRFQAATL